MVLKQACAPKGHGGDDDNEEHLADHGTPLRRPMELRPRYTKDQALCGASFLVRQVPSHCSVAAPYVLQYGTVMVRCSAIPWGIILGPAGRSAASIVRPRFKDGASSVWSFWWASIGEGIVSAAWSLSRPMQHSSSSLQNGSLVPFTSNYY